MTFHFGILSEVDAFVASLAFVGTIAFIIVFDHLTSIIENHLSENEIYSKILRKLYKELMAMGFVSLIVTVTQSLNERKVATDRHWSAVIDAMDFVGYILFFVAIFFVAHALYIIAISIIASKRYAKFHTQSLADTLEIFSHIERNWWTKVLFYMRYLPLSEERAQVEFKVTYSLFRDIYWLPPDFDYGSYLSGCLDHYALNLINIEFSSWAIMIFLCGLNYARITLLDSGMWKCDDFQYDNDKASGTRALAVEYGDVSKRCAEIHLQLYIVCGAILTGYVLLLFPIGKMYESR
jgi:hypothetical protein